MLAESIKSSPLRDVTNSKNKKSLMPYGNVAIGKNHMKKGKKKVKCAILQDVPHCISETETKSLRQRKIRYYRELSITSSTSNENESKTNAKHVPIYLKNCTSNKTSTKRDPFEFVVEPSVKKRNKNDNSSDSDSIIYDKITKEILDGIVHKEKQKKKQQIRNIVNKQTVKKVAKVPKSTSSNPSLHNAPLTSTPKPHTSQKINIISDILVPAASVSSLDLDTSLPSTSQKVNIVSDVLVPPPSPSSVDLDESFSMDYDDSVRDSKIHPWRGDKLNLRREPYWLALKDSSLPFYNQEMILEQELIEKLPPLKPVSNKENSLVQTQILDFVRSKTPRLNNQSTLFDDGYLSPIKCNEKENRTPTHESEELVNYFGFSDDDGDKENTPLSNTGKRDSHLTLRTSRRSKIKCVSDHFSTIQSKKTDILHTSQLLANRSVFSGNNVDQNKENTPPSKNTRKSSKFALSKLETSGIHNSRTMSTDTENRLTRNKRRKTSNINQMLNAKNFFGFCDEEDRNMQPMTKRETELPLRLSTRELRKIRNDLAEELVASTNTNNALNETLPETTDAVVGLFEDLEPEKPVQRTYAAKRRKKIFPSKPRVICDEDGEKSKKKRKDMRTPAEEDEFNKWAASFNAMCDEIELHSLEISNI